MNRPGMYLDIVPAAPVSCARCGEAVAKGTGGYAVAAGMHGMFDPLPSLIRRLCHACFQAEKLEAECRAVERDPHDNCPLCSSTGVNR